MTRWASPASRSPTCTSRRACMPCTSCSATTCAAPSPSSGREWEAYRLTPTALGAGRAVEPDRGDGAARQPVPHAAVQRRPRGRGDGRADAAYDDLFRFKIDFVRRRALPLLKAGAHVEATAEDHAFVDGFMAGLTDDGARELALARAGCALLDREEAARVSGTRRGEAGRRARDRVAQALVRGARARPALSPLGHLPLSRNARSACIWCTSCGRTPRCRS